jgi:glucans biosynthesis protein C
MSEHAASATSPARRPELDRLRIAACLLLFPFHTLQVFDLHQAYHIKSATQLWGLEVISRTINAWHMPLFFALSGMAIMYALRSRSPLALLVNRCARLLVPLILGLLTIAPLIKYIERLGGRDMTYEGVEIIPNWIAPPFDEFWLNFWSDIDVFSWSHLWYLAYLLLFTGGLLPVLSWLRQCAPVRADMARILVWLPLPVFALVELLLRSTWGDSHNFIFDWANISIYIALFLGGAMLVQSPDIEIQLRRQWLWFAGLGFAGATLMITADTGALADIGRASANWGGVAALIGGAGVLFQREWPGEAYLAKAQLPIYVLHHAPLVVLAYTVRDLPWPIAVRMPVIMGGAVLISFAFYHVLVRPAQAWTATRREPIPA